MAYSELIKSFGRIREYMREFFVYGFKSREEYTNKSARSYDNERRRIESWLGEYMRFYRNESGKNVFLSVNSRAIPQNPLYRAFKAKSFTDIDITLHFYVLDILARGEKLTCNEIIDRLTDCLVCFEGNFDFDESTVRKKLKEYTNLGLLKREKSGKRILYYKTTDNIELQKWEDALGFFAEVDPLGVVGSYVLDKTQQMPTHFCFKHNYILHALESEVFYALTQIIENKNCAEIKLFSSRRAKTSELRVLPLKIYVSVQNGRCHLLSYNYLYKCISFFRLDSIKTIKTLTHESDFDFYLDQANQFTKNVWGVSGATNQALEHTELLLRVEDGEEYIMARLLREKRCGTVEMLDKNTCRFFADVYDAMEMLPWVRTFIGRVIKFECSNEAVVKTFYDDLSMMYAHYEEVSNAIS